MRGCRNAASEHFGVPALVFNDAGIQGDIAPLVDYSLDDFQKVMDINVTGIFHVLREAARASTPSRRRSSAPGGCVLPDRPEPHRQRRHSSRGSG